MVASRKLPQRPPCKEMALRIWTSPTCWMMSPSSTSKESSSVLAAARSGRCQPGGGGGRRKRRGGERGRGRGGGGGGAGVVAFEVFVFGGTAGEVEFIGALGAEGAEDG